MQPDKNMDLSRRFVRLPLEQRRLFFQKLVAKNISLSQLPIPVSREEVAVLPLSYAQQRQWFLWQMAPESSAYHIPAVLRLRGRLDIDILQRSFEALIARHETLRTCFRQEQDLAVQVIHAEMPFELPRESLGDSSEAVLQKRIEEEIQTLFDLQHGPLLRVRLLHLAENEHVLVLTLHHIIADGWSMGRMVEELVHLYAASREGREASLAALPIQYADYALWQRSCMEAGERERQLEYWCGLLDGEQSPLELPGDRSRPALQSYRGGEVGIALSEALTRNLRELARSRGVTLFMLLLAAFQSLLHRHSGQADIRVGVPVANRLRRETEGLIGFFVNTQVLKADFELNTRFDDLLSQVKQRALEAQAYQDLPFEQLVEALQPERGLSHSPLFQVMYNHQSEGQGSVLSLPGLRVENLPRETSTAQFDLTLDTFESEQGLRASLTYATDLFDRSTAQRLADHWRNLLEAICVNPQQRISELPILATAEWRQVVHEWNDTAAPYPHGCLHELFQQQVARTPQALALIDGEREYSYGALNQRANRLAHKLRELGVGPDVLVGIAMQRQLDMLVGLLAILKAGGAYVPLDPEYPRERQAYMLEDSGACLLLTQSVLLDQLPHDGAAQMLVVDDLALDAYPEHDLEPSSTPDNLAYCIYTSGSTGKPKGVMIEHRNAAALIGWSRSVYGQDDLQGVLASTSICFDLSVWEFFVTLSSGGFVVLADNALALPELVARQRVRLINTVPSAIRMLCEAGQIPESVRVINLAGEPLAQEVVENLYGLEHIECVYDLYGPSEDTTYSTYTLRTPGGSANIGRPLSNSGVHLIDATGQATGIGRGGELCMVGAGLARGYLNRPALTAEKFLPDPFSERQGGRLYRTGDLARYRPDGVIEYLGRIDHQVKIRGFRIELGEIEARLLQQDRVQEAVVLAREGVNGKQLVGYVVPTESIEPQRQRELQEVLRAALKATLPDYMVPTYLLFLDALPLTPNGKLDRKRLPQPDITELQQGHVAPRNELERQLASIWQEVLKCPSVGVADNFFELGGDSIVSLQVVSRARQAGLQFTPRELFQHQTVQGLAGVVRRVEALCIEQGPVSGGLPLTPIQQWFFEQAIPQRNHWNQSILLTPQVPLQVEALRAALSALLVHHDALRSRFAQHDEGWSAEFAAAQEDVELLWVRAVGDEQEMAFVTDQAQCSLDLNEGPLLRAVLLELPDATQRLLLVIHHLVIDGVSWRVLLDDLQRAYARSSEGLALDLPARTSSFKAWAERMAAHARTPELEAELTYWQTQLADACDELPVIDVQGRRQQKHIGYAITRLDRDWTRRLLQEAPAAYRTQVNDLLLTALARVICRWSGQAQMLVRLEGHGREELFDDIDLTRTVGWFTSMYPLRLVPLPELADSIKSIKEQLRAVPGKGIGYGLLRYLGSAEAKQVLEGLPMGAIVFNYLGQFDQSFDAEEALFVPAKESSGAGMDENAPMDGLLNLNGRIFDGELSLDWGFSRELFDVRTIERLACEYADELRALVEHCCEPGRRSLTPSDVALARLTQSQLDRLPIPAAQIADIYPLSPMQQGMLFHSLYEQEGGDYVNQMRVDVEGLDVERFRHAWQGAVDVHEVLRAAFISDLAQPLQIIRRQMPLPFVVLDWRGLADLDARLDGWANTDRERGFDLADEPLLRLAVIRTGERSHHLIYTCHHILLDGWSNSRLLGEVLQRYAGAPVEPPSGAYRDYIDWLQRQSSQAREAFWTAQLAALDAPTRLTHALRPVLATEQTGHAQYSQVFDPALTHRLGAFARGLRVTVNTLVQAAWLLLLRRYTGQETVCFGATVAGRPPELAGVEEQIGLFINTLPVIGSPRAEQTVVEWVAQIQAYNLTLREFEHTPLYEVQRWARLGNEPLFDSLLVFENYPVAEALQQGAPAGLRFGEVGNYEQTNYPLALAVLLGAHLEVHYSYDRQHFDEERIQQVAEHFGNLLVSLCERPQARLAELEMLAPAEQAQILQRWDQTAVQYPNERFVHQLVADRAAQTPEAVAVIFADQTLSYGELDVQANRLAHRLIELGVGPEVRVAIAMRRSSEIMVAFLAVLKAGGAYVPLDVAYPPERLLYMMKDCSAALVLTQEDLQDQLPLPEGVPILAVERSEQWQDRPATAPVVALHGDNLAYVIYTSGTTGLPKGVAVSHGPLVSHIQATGERYETSADDCELHFMSFAFDGAHEGWMHPLINGARVLIRDDSLWLPEQTYAQMHQHRVTLAVFPPVYLQQLAEYAEQDGNPPPTRVYCFGGDAVPQASYDLAWRALRPHYLFNGYGPTETVVTPLLWKARPHDPCGAAYAPIGTLLGTRRGYVLDADLNLLPVGLAGELYLGGEGVARGYLERAALTAERFVPDPFGTGQRVYRSGDLTRARGDGVVDYLGRVDHQVKIRGFRIELGEIEARLLQQPAVREAVVLARDGASGKQLLGYVVTHEALTAERQRDLRESLKTALKASLPEYMVPAHLLFLEAMPLTPNGKLDRKALPQPDIDEMRQDYVAPRSEMEQHLALIWQDTLRLPQVGLNDNFFELGGDSIVSLQLVSRARQQGIRFTPKELFQHQTVQELARVARRLEEVQVEQGPVRGAVPLMPIQRWFFEQDIPQPHHWNQSVLLEARDRVWDGSLLEQALRALVIHHDALRLAFESEGARYRELDDMQASWAGKNILWQVDLDSIDALEALGAKAQRSLDIAAGSLVRAVLVNLADGSQRLLLVIHHLVVDGVSWRILLEDLDNLYRQQATGQPQHLPGRTSSLQAWASRLLEHAGSDTLRQELGYWQTLLQDADPSLPCDDPAGTQRLCDAEHVQIRLDAAMTHKLLQVAPTAYRTQINDLLLSALAQAVCRWTGRDHALIQLEGHGREDLFEDIDLSRTVGWFTSVYPLRLVPEAEPGRSLMHIKEQLRAIPGKGIGFGLLRYLGDVACHEALRQLPQPRITFNYLGQFEKHGDGNNGSYGFSADSAGAELSEQAPLGNWLSINGQVFDGVLSLTWTFSREVFHRGSIERLAQDYQRELESLIEHCCQPGVGALTPADVPLAALTQAQLDALALEPAKVEDLYPLTPMQRGMLPEAAHEQGDFICQHTLDVRGLQPERFRQAWQATLDAHGMLRTGFIAATEQRQALQVVYRSVEAPFNLVDGRGLTPLEVEDRLLQDRLTPFAMERAPLLRLLLVRLAEDEYRVALTSHHILLDGWSASRLYEDILRAYMEGGLAPVAGGFRDYLAWLVDVDTQADQRFWHQVLARLDAPSLLAPAGGHKTCGHGHLFFTLSQERSSALDEFARQQRVTVNTLVQAAWLLLLSRRLKQQTVACGVTLSGRPAELPGIERQLGLYINDMPLVARVDADLSIAEWLQELQAFNLRMRDHGHAALDELQRWHGSALFDSVIVFENYPGEMPLGQSEGEALQFLGMSHHEQTSTSLTLYVELDGVWGFHFDYRLDCFDDAQVEALGEALQRTLDKLVERAPCTRLGELALQPA